MRHERFRRMLLNAALAVVGMTSANAELVPHFGGPDESKLSLQQASAARSNFLAGLSSYGVEDVEDLSGANPTLTFGSTGITATTGFSNGVNTAFQYSVSGVKFIWDTEGANDWLEFSEPITAFGSYIVQGGDGSSAPPTNAPTNTLTFRLENTFTETSKDIIIQNLGPNWPFYNVIFVGVTDTQPFNRISFIETYDHDGLLWDDLIAGHLAVSAPLPGDFDHNEIVNGDDLSVWQEQYGETGNESYMLGDADGDGDTDGRDFLIWQQEYNASSGEVVSVSAIPEPSAFSLVGLGLVGFAAMCRKAIYQARIGFEERSRCLNGFDYCR